MIKETEVAKFKALRFRSSDGDIAELVSPPYDVFDYGDELDCKLRSNPHNIVHILKPEGEGMVKYKNSADIIERFLSEKVLLQEEEESFYVLHEEGQKHTRTGLMAIVRIDPEYNRIKEHERTKKTPLEDRINLLFSTGTNTGPVFAVASDRDEKFITALQEDFKEDNLLYDFRSYSGAKTRLYRTDNNIYSDILRDSVLYIADGHHRYKTAIHYAKEMHKKNGNKDGRFNYVMMYIVPCNNLTIHPTHRMIGNVTKKEAKEILEKIRDNFGLEKKENLCIPDSGSLGVYFDKAYYTFNSTLKEKPDTLFLDEKIFRPFMPSEMKLDYLSGDMDVLEDLKKKVDRGDFQMAFLLAPMSFEGVKKEADKREMLPPKSTFFYPKVPSGLLMYRAR